MAEIFFISDTHLGHANILTFTRHDGTPLRPGFKDIDHMNRHIFARWRETVGPKDKVYHLGDVAFNKVVLELMQSLPGNKRLIRGNHDKFKLTTYRKVFQEIYGVRQLFGYWFTHVPMWEGSVNEARVKANIHGHLHGCIVPHPKYFNANVECIDYTPISFDAIQEAIKQRIS